MLRELGKEELLQHTEDMYELAARIDKGVYPNWRDGLKQKSDLVERIERFANKIENKDADFGTLVYEEAEQIFGYILYRLGEDDSINFDYFYVACDFAKVLEEVLSYMEAHYPGKKIMLGVSTTNTSAVDFCEEKGWRAIEHSKMYVFRFKPNMTFEVSHKVIPVTEENFEDFRTVHKVNEGEMYWNSDRIYKAWKEEGVWELFLWKEDDEPAAVIYNDVFDGDCAQIIGMDSIKPAAEGRKELLKAALNAAYKRGAKHNYHWPENDAEVEECTEVGFEHLDDYVCYKYML
ncbi:MAG: hypothetical protein E7277_08925 [Lachnospiraceae bacterium]|nr:hypothetical protein [Lachnospiraceae bacterium]